MFYVTSRDRLRIIMIFLVGMCNCAVWDFYEIAVRSNLLHNEKILMIAGNEATSRFILRTICF